MDSFFNFIDVWSVRGAWAAMAFAAIYFPAVIIFR
jgi:hypothetical protein